MLEKFLREVVTIIVGKQAEEIANLLNSNKHVNEFLIAKKLGMTINQTRNILYKISDQGLVSSIRKKDKKKGWFTYFWKIEILKSLEFLREALIKRIDQINSQIKSREIKQFYVCELCNVEFTEENALLNDFTCSECGNVFSVKDNAPIIKELRKNLVKLKKDLEEVEIEIAKEKEKIEKERAKEIKKRKEESDTKRAEARKKAKREREKLKGKEKKLIKKKTKVKIKKNERKKIGKKIIKKKVVKDASRKLKNISKKSKSSKKTKK